MAPARWDSHEVCSRVCALVSATKGDLVALRDQPVTRDAARGASADLRQWGICLLGPIALLLLLELGKLVDRHLGDRPREDGAQSEHAALVV